MTSLGLVVSSVVLTAVSIPAMRALARRWHLQRPNFKGKIIPVGFGFMLVLVGAPIYLWMLISGNGRAESAVFLIGVVGFGVLGLVDDVYGSREAGGFGGHLRLLCRGKVSTGLIKALVGGLIALGVGLFLSGFHVGEGLVNGLVISLSANFLNLLDLRPGRAVSCFWMGLVIVIFSTMKTLPVRRELVPIVVPAACLTVLDRSALVMMGDAGSNVLGAVLGIAIAYGAGLPGKAGFLLFVIAVHLYSEKRSISKLIESNEVLRRIDRLLGER
jgi:UDP-N-acetylmuramyl pentapeptide phosphotransferase/UDP-N-acetylglucosamine-1-phosphate transferase